MTTTDTVNRVDNGIRIALGVGGILATLGGILILAWPVRTAMVLTVLVAIYAITAGLVYAGIGIWSKNKRGWGRFGNILLGVIFVIAGIIALANLGATTAALAFTLGLVVGIMWIIEGAVSLSTLRGAPSKGWSIFYGILSLIAGVMMLFAPVWGMVILYWLLGISLIVLGVVQIVRAFTFGRRNR